MHSSTSPNVAALAACVIVFACAPANRPDPVMSNVDHSVDAEDSLPTVGEVLQRLQQGNRRFVNGQPHHDHTSREWRESLTQGQNPLAIIIGCADSRVPTEIIFDQGLGDIFVIRNAGNVIHTDVIGSIQYAVDHLHTPLVVVLGHERCGAVTAALASREGRLANGPELQMVLRLIEPALAAEGLSGTDPDIVAAGVEASVRWSVAHLRQLGAERPHPDAHKVVVMGAIYELDSGRIRFLN